MAEGSGRVDRIDAGRALDDVERRRQQVLEEISVPAWYWWALALAWIGLGVVAVAAPAWVYVVATVGFGAAHAAVAPHVIDGRHGSRQLTVRADVVSRRTSALVIGFLVVLVVVTVGIALVADALDAPQPALIASVIVAIMVLIGGPRLLAYERHRAQKRVAR